MQYSIQYNIRKYTVNQFLDVGLLLFLQYFTDLIFMLEFVLGPPGFRQLEFTLSGSPTLRDP